MSFSSFKKKLEDVGYAVGDITKETTGVDIISKSDREKQAQNTRVGAVAQPSTSEIAAKESDIKTEEAKVQAETVAKEKEAAKKRKGRGSTILTGPLGLLTEAPVLRKTLLGS
jgi:hypothetical protein